MIWRPYIVNFSLFYTCFFKGFCKKANNANLTNFGTHSNPHYCGQTYLNGEILKNIINSMKYDVPALFFLEKTLWAPESNIFCNSGLESIIYLLRINFSIRNFSMWWQIIYASINSFDNENWCYEVRFWTKTMQKLSFLESIFSELQNKRFKFIS